MSALKTVDAETLIAQPLKPIPFIVDKLIPPGLYILAGSSKIGKLADALAQPECRSGQAGMGTRHDAMRCIVSVSRRYIQPDTKSVVRARILRRTIYISPSWRSRSVQDCSSRSKRLSKRSRIAGW